MQTYLVGGAVRDQLLGRTAHDHDWVVVGATPAAMLALGYEQVGADFPVFLHPKTHEEYALARTERKHGQGYQGFVVDFDANVTLEQDLLRRDLTINAMAMGDDDTLIDPYGGCADLEQRVLRHVSPAFSEDPLRVLRVARFAARFAPLGFIIADETLTLMTEMSQQGDLNHLVAERVWQETQRALGEDHADVYFEVLQRCGALAVWFPELQALFGVPQPEQHHPEIDCGIHALLSLKAACLTSSDVSVRWSALVHDLGKGLTPKAEWPRHIGHEKRGLTPLKQLAQRLKIPKEAQQLARLASELHTHAHRAFELRGETLLGLFNQLDAWRKPERLAQFLQVCEADSHGRTGLEQAPYPQADYIRQAYQQALTIDAKAMIDQGHQGAAIRSALDKARANHLQRWRKHAGTER